VQSAPIGQLAQKNHAKTVFGALSIFLTLGILFLTLWPFNPFPHNKVRWLTGSDGIQFEWAGVVLSPRPVAQGRDATLSGPSSLEIWLKPSETQYVYTVLDFSEPGNPFRFRLRQYHEGLIVSRDWRDPDGRMKRVKIDLDASLQRGKLTLVTLSSADRGTSLYLDGKLKQTYPNFRFTAGDLSGQIVLGTAPVDSEPWAGEIHGLAIYGKELTPGEVLAHYQNWTQANSSATSDLADGMARYPFSERTGHEIRNQVGNGTSLEIPRSFQVPQKAFLRLPWNEFEWSRTYFADVLRNIAGFVPFGFVVCAYLSLTRHRHRVVLLTILAGGTLSLCIEVLQAYIPERVSGTTDIVTNTLGAALGVILVRSTPIGKILRRGTAATDLTISETSTSQPAE
jgi:glycopeptide antibiotics resistance protein